MMFLLIFFRVLSGFLSSYIMYRCAEIMRENNNICKHKVHAFIFTSMIIYQVVSIKDMATLGLSGSLVYWYYWDILIMYSVVLLINSKK